MALPLVLLVKRWAKIEGLNKAFEGNLSLGRRRPQATQKKHYEYSTLASFREVPVNAKFLCMASLWSQENHSPQAPQSLVMRSENVIQS